MNLVLLCLSVGFWMLVMMRIPLCILFFGLVFLLFLWLRFHKPMILLLWGLCIVLSLFLTHPKKAEPSKGIYQIVEIKSSYCIAQSKNVKIVVYGLKDPKYYDRYFVSHWSLIEELKNEHLFSFAEHLSKQNIQYCTQLQNKDLRSSRHSLRGLLYDRFTQNLFYKENLYGIHKEDTYLNRLGIPMIGTFYTLYRILRRFYKQKTVQIVIFILSVLYGYFFTFSVSFIRYICFQLGNILYSKSRQRLSFSMIFFLILMPGYAKDFTFVLPVTIKLVQILDIPALKRYLSVKGILLLYQLIYFHHIDFPFVLLFSVLRKGYGWIVLGSLIPGVRQILFYVWKPLRSMFSYPTFLQWYYVPGIVFYGLLLLFLIAERHRRLLLSGLCVLPFVSTYLNPFFQVNTINIGQGDCTLIVEPFHKSAVMIDCGQNRYRDNVKEIIMPVLRRYQIRTLDALILTHSDFDHSGGYEELSKSIDIRQVIRKREEKVPVDYSFYSLLPKAKGNDANDNSIINYFTYDKLHYLFMGDAGTDVEEQLLDTYKLKADVLKLGHHGSRTSSSYCFLDALRPKLGLVSVGARNMYGHPSSAVIANCHDLGIHSLQTSQVGNIHIYSLHSLSFFTTATGLFGIIRL